MKKKADAVLLMVFVSVLALYCKQPGAAVEARNFSEDSSTENTELPEDNGNGAELSSACEDVTETEIPENRRSLTEEELSEICQNFTDGELTESIKENVTLSEDTELESFGWIDGEESCFRVWIQYKEQPQEEYYRHKEDYFFFLEGDKVEDLHTEYADEGKDCDFHAYLEDVTFDRQKDLLISLGHTFDSCFIYKAYVYEDGTYCYKSSFPAFYDYKLDSEDQVIYDYTDYGTDCCYGYRNGEFVEFAEYGHDTFVEENEYMDGVYLGSAAEFEKCVEDIEENYPRGTLNLRFSPEMADVDTSALAEHIRERDCSVFLEGQGVYLENGTGSGVMIAYEDDAWADRGEGEAVSDYMKPFVKEEIEEKISGLEGVYLSHFLKQDMGKMHFYFYGFRDDVLSSDGMCSTMVDDRFLFLLVQGEGADGESISRTVEIPGSEMGQYVSRAIYGQERDINHDGVTDLLLNLGANGGTGGHSTSFLGFLWNEGSQRYEVYEGLPSYIPYWRPDDVLVGWSRSGCDHEYVKKYEERGGVYVETERVEITEEPVEEDGESHYGRVCRYYQMGELVEEHILDGNFNVVERYPDMDYWPKG